MSTTIYEQRGNSGNSVIGSRDLAGGSNAVAHAVHVRSLDSLVPRARRKEVLQPIRLLKMDTQGFECNVLRGMRSLLQSKRLRMLNFEVSPQMLAAQGCSQIDILFLDIDIALFV